MEVNILDYVAFIRLKNGNYKVTHDESHMENIYRLLREMGYGFIKKNNRTIYFRKENNVILSAIFGDFQKAFFKAIKNCDAAKLPGNLTLFDVYKYYRKVPFRKSALFASYLEYDLTEDQLENFTIQSKYTADRFEEILETTV